MENKYQHLGFIEAVIARMNSNSFLIKGWTVTIIAALFALAANGANHSYVLIAYVPLVAFWILDGFFLSKDRQYVQLYEKVRKMDEATIDYSMNTKEFNTGRNTWLRSIFSKTFVPFYGVLVLLCLVVMFKLK